jgi:Na+/proline symporter
MDPLSMQPISLSWIDLTIIAAYLVGIVFCGAGLTRLASRSIDSYFLGARRMPWWLLGLSGTAGYFDVTGVMWTIAFFYIMGQRFLWIQWEWGFITMGCFAAFMGKWLRRSEVMTGAEWMVIRFGDGVAGQFARTAYAVMAVVIAVAFIGFAFYGCGQFFHVFVPQLAPHTLAITLMLFTAVYTVTGALSGVVLTGMIQFLLMLLGSAILIALALGMSSYEALAAEVPAEWFGFRPMWHWPHLERWEMTARYSLFLLLSVVWVTKGVFLSLGGPQQLYDMQRFLAARNPREAAQAGMIWGVAMTPMFMVSAAVGVIGLIRWGGNLPHPEKLYPVVIGTMLPVGIKGLVLAGLLSAFMSTFSSTVNAGASYLVRDGYQQFLRPGASSRELVWASRAASALVIVAGMVVGMHATNIDVIFAWIMIILGTAVLMPNVLRWFWWRFNGWGYAVGTLCGVTAAIVSALWFADTPVYISFFVLLAISVATSLVASVLTPPTDLETLKVFYRRIRPPGFWGPVRAAVLSEDPQTPVDSFAKDLLSAVIAGAGLH